jgi:hypothetical protein
MAITTVLAIAGLHGHGNRADVSRQLASLGTLEWHDHATDLIARAASGGLDAVVTELDDERGRSIASTLVELATCCPALPVVIYDQVNSATLPKLLAASTPGLRTTFVVRPYERLGAALQRAVSPSWRPGVTPVLLQRFVPPAPASVSVFLALAVLAAPVRRGMEEVAGWSGVSARTIERRLLRAHWPTARVILHSLSALDAVWLMSEYGWSARRVQLVRAFPHPSSITRLLRYCGTAPATFREDGGFPAALEHVARVLSTHETL